MLLHMKSTLYIQNLFSEKSVSSMEPMDTTLDTKYILVDWKKYSVYQVCTSSSKKLSIHIHIGKKTDRWDLMCGPTVWHRHKLKTRYVKRKPFQTWKSKKGVGTKINLKSFRHGLSSRIPICIITFWKKKWLKSFRIILFILNLTNLLEQLSKSSFISKTNVILSFIWCVDHNFKANICWIWCFQNISF